MYCPKSNTFQNTHLSQGYVCTSSILVNLLTEKTMEETCSGATEVLDRLPGPTEVVFTEQTTTGRQQIDACTEPDKHLVQ